LAVPLRYRSEIDGLRAIAVTSVLLYHAEIVTFGKDWFTGGYIGVDIFFVISGYLISRIIIAELEETSRFNLLNFYERRARRILPMLLVVIWVSLPFAWELLLPTAFKEYSKSILSSLLFFSNLFFYNNTAAYGTESALLKPFLHTWSLSVEEQFYIAFPIIMIGVHKWYRSHFVAIFAVCICISLLLAEVITAGNSALAFFWLPTRLWELLAGVLLAAADIKYGRIFHSALHQTLPIIGLCLITYSLLFFDSQTPHPSVITALPVAGTALIIYFANSTELVGRVLSSRLLVGVGLISYSLYLWHYPIFAFARINENTPDNYDKFEWLGIAFVLSIASYFLIEKPFRRKTAWPTKKFVPIACVAFPSTAVMVFLLFPFNFDYIDIEDLATNRPILMTDYSGYRNNWFDKRDNRTNAFIFPGRTRILIVGNSHGTDTYNAVTQNGQLFDELEITIIHHTERELWGPQYQVFCFLDFLKNGSNICKGKKFATKSVLTRIYQNADVILFSTRWSEKDLMALQEIVTILDRDGKKVVITSNAPQQPHTDITKGDTPLKTFIKVHRRLPIQLEQNLIERTTYENANQNAEIIAINKKLSRIAQANNAVFLDKMDYICDTKEEKCRVLTPTGHLISWDYGHHTIAGAKYLGGVMKEINWLAPLHRQPG
jgi:peptidoglycan/LPS O-acetylase OafA/YrhL